MKIGIAIPLYRNVEKDFFVSFIDLLFELKNKKYEIEILYGTATIDHARNVLVKNAIVKKCDYIWFLDTDHKIPKDDILGKLLKTIEDKKASIVSALYFGKEKPHLPVIRIRRLKEWWEPLADVNPNEIIEVDGIGMGCCLIDMKVFKKINYPYFEFKYLDVRGYPMHQSEDLTFCEKAKNAGYKIYVDTKLVVEHIGSSADEKTYLIYKKAILKYKKLTEDIIADCVEFDNIPEEKVIANLKLGIEKFKEGWEQNNPKTKEEREKFYKESYWGKYDLVSWHLGNRLQFDEELVQNLKKMYPNKDCSILDYGCGIGQNSYLLAKEGFKDISLHDLNLDFAEFRFKKYKLPYRKLDLNKKYDVILCFDVLEHLDDKDFEETINLFKKLKKDNGKAIITATFVDGGMHPMHFEGSDKKVKMIKELMENADARR